MSTGSGNDQPPLPHRFSVEQYSQLAEAGILTMDDRVELLDGWIVHKEKHTPRHAGTIQLVQHMLDVLLPADCCLRCQSSVLTANSVPEPDIAIVRGHHRDYLKEWPKAADVGLVVEVSGQALNPDRSVKARIYAGAQIERYWIVNVKEGRLETFANPTDAAEVPAYQQRQVFGPDDEVPFVIDGKEFARISVRELLP